jgi:hypothetical protein
MSGQTQINLVNAVDMQIVFRSWRTSKTSLSNEMHEEFDENGYVFAHKFMHYTIHMVENIYKTMNFKRNPWVFVCVYVFVRQVGVFHYVSLLVHSSIHLCGWHGNKCCVVYNFYCLSHTLCRHFFCLLLYERCRSFLCATFERVICTWRTNGH